MARFSPDGQLIAAADGNNVRLWDSANGRLVRELSPGDKGRVYSVAFSPTDNRLLAVGYGGKDDVSYVALWDIDAGTELARLPGATDLPNFQVTRHSGPVGALAFSPDGKNLVAGFGSKNMLTRSGTPTPLKVWEVASRRLIRRLNGPRNYCVSLDFSRDGTLLASGSHDGTATLWSTATWIKLQTLENQDKDSLYAQSGVPAMVEDVAFSPDGKTLAMASREGSVQLWDVATGKHLETLKGHSAAVSAVVFSPDGRTLASGSHDQTVRLWNIETRRELMQLDPGNIELGYVQTLAFSPDGKRSWPEETAPPSGRLRPTSGTIPTGPPWNWDCYCIRTPTSRAASGCCPRTFGCTKHWQSLTRKKARASRPGRHASQLACVAQGLAASRGGVRSLGGRRSSRPRCLAPHARSACDWRRRCCKRIGLPSQRSLLQGGAKRRTQEGLPAVVDQVGAGFAYSTLDDTTSVTELCLASWLRRLALLRAIHS